MSIPIGAPSSTPEAVALREQVRRSRAYTPALARAVRQAARVTQAQLADAVGVTEPTVWRWEHGHRWPRGVLRDRYFAALDALRELP